MARSVNFKVAAPPTMSKRDVCRARRGAGALAELWERLPSGDWQALFDEVERTLREPLDGLGPGEVHPLTKAPVPSAEERARVQFLSLLDRFEARSRLLADALTAPQVARLLGSSRQTSLSRAQAGTLFAVYDRGAWRFPSWQFDPEGPDGVVAGLADVLEALAGLSPLAKLVWLSRETPMYEGRSPVEALRDGELERVLAAAGAAVASYAAA
jgi:hypothetical protein